MSTTENKRSNFESEVWPKELERIRARRKLADLPEGEPAKDSIGLALSGGGIRSATFNLGVLQALQRYEVLKKVDLLSTVSGGGYIGSCLTWFMSKSATPEFPFGTKRADHDGLGGKVLAWLRAHGSFLTPGDGLNRWALAAAVATGIIVNLLILLPIFILFIYLLTIPYPYALSADDSFFSFHNSWAFLRMIGFLLIAVFFLMVLSYAVPMQGVRNITRNRRMRVNKGYVLMWGVLGIAVGCLPLIYNFAVQIVQSLMLSFSSISLMGAISFLSGLFKRKDGDEATGLRSFLLGAGLALFSLGIILLLYHWVLAINLAYANNTVEFWKDFSVPLIFSVFFAYNANINHVSMHRFYRDCLMEAYMPAKYAQIKDEKTGEIKTAEWQDADKCLLHEIPQTAAPYHIINTMMNTIGSEESKLSGRGGENFIFSPLVCGSESTGYADTKTYEGGLTNLATAFAISGAAVDSNTYATRSRPLNFIMTLFNVRLGYWIGNPKYYPTKPSRASLWYWYMFSEMLGRGLDETRKQLHLSDGGHYENLGLYELLRRKCKLILVSDAGADFKRGFGDLSKLMEMARLDFGVKIDLDVKDINIDKTTKHSAKAFAIGSITYDDDSIGKIVYLKPSLIEKLPEDIYGYGREHPLFPHESTGDQFFDEPQFEAYRELGYQLGKDLVHSKEWGSL